METLPGTGELCVSGRCRNQVSSETVVRHNIKITRPRVFISGAFTEVNEKGHGKECPHHKTC